MKDVIKSDRVERNAHVPESVLGKWFWITTSDWNDKEDRWLGCVTHEGSNYVLLSGIGGHGNRQARIHNDEFFDELTPEPEPQKYIDEQVRYWQGVSAALVHKVAEITRSLGVDTKALPHETGSRALTVPMGKREIKQYKKELVKAQEKTLPKLFEEIKDANKMVARWMTAPILGMEAQLGIAQATVTHIKRRIYAIELYAGVTEEIEQIASGDPASADEKVHLFQRRLCMDEECLVDYHAGGMEFKSIDKFEEWLLKPTNLNRLLPKPRCIVSMVVRRRSKERQTTNVLSLFINIKLDQQDKKTFLYIRNGDNVFRLETEIDFSSSLFPDRATFDPQRPLVAKFFGSRVDQIIDRAEYEVLVAKEEERERNSEQWLKDNPIDCFDDSWDRDTSNPYRSRHDFRAGDYRPFDPSSVYYDDIAEVVSDRIAHYNRVALIVQGLFDRSAVFQPHQMSKIWRPEDFFGAIELVYDNSAVLHDGDAPDFELYQRELNLSLKAGCFAIGQEEFWMRREAQKYNERGNRSAYRNFHPVTLHQPYGDPGPGYVAEVGEWNRNKREATFRWERQRQTLRRYSSDRDVIPSTVTAPDKCLLNVTAYTPGDYKRFYSDFRTRAKYLKWAPFLLGAEDWYAGRRKW